MDILGPDPMSKYLTCVLVLCLLLCSCKQPDPRESAEVVEPTSQTTATSTHFQMVLKLDRLVMLAQRDGNFIRNIDDVERLDLGYAVLDQATPQILIFDEAGNYLRHLGRKGQGPGEFEYIFNLFRVGSAVAVKTPQKILVFAQNGDLLAELKNRDLGSIMGGFAEWHKGLLYLLDTEAVGEGRHRVFSWPGHDAAPKYKGSFGTGYPFEKKKGFEQKLVESIGITQTAIWEASPYASPPNRYLFPGFIPKSAAPLHHDGLTLEKMASFNPGSQKDRKNIATMLRAHKVFATSGHVLVMQIAGPRGFTYDLYRENGTPVYRRLRGMNKPVILYADDQQLIGDYFYIPGMFAERSYTQEALFLRENGWLAEEDGKFLWIGHLTVPAK